MINLSASSNHRPHKTALLLVDIPTRMEAIASRFQNSSTQASESNCVLQYITIFPENGPEDAGIEYFAKAFPTEGEKDMS